MLDQKRPNRITSWAHGDLNARNILVAENRPCLIDYAFTREGEPLMFDFVRLEGTLAAEILPASAALAAAQSAYIAPTKKSSPEGVTPLPNPARLCAPYASQSSCRFTAAAISWSAGPRAARMSAASRSAAP